jgi:hypothetical protein
MAAARRSELRGPSQYCVAGLSYSDLIAPPSVAEVHTDSWYTAQSHNQLGPSARRFVFLWVWHLPQPLREKTGSLQPLPDRSSSGSKTCCMPCSFLVRPWMPCRPNKVSLAPWICLPCLFSLCSIVRLFSPSFPWLLHFRNEASDAPLGLCPAG